MSTETKTATRFVFDFDEAQTSGSVLSAHDADLLRKMVEARDAERGEQYEEIIRATDDNGKARKAERDEWQKVAEGWERMHASELERTEEKRRLLHAAWERATAAEALLRRYREALEAVAWLDAERRDCGECGHMVAVCDKNGGRTRTSRHDVCPGFIARTALATPTPTTRHECPSCDLDDSPLRRKLDEAYERGERMLAAGPAPCGTACEKCGGTGKRRYREGTVSTGQVAVACWTCGGIGRTPSEPEGTR